MTISLYPCGSVITCGPCPECDPLYDYASPADMFPPVRLIVYNHLWGGTLYSGSITYTPAGGGSDVTIAMSLVSAGNKLCIYRDGSYVGPLLYSLGVPPDATLVSITYTLFYPPSTYDVFTKDIVGTCTDGTTQVLVSQSELPICGTGATVVSTGTACPTPCAENSGSFTASTGIATTGGASGFCDGAGCAWPISAAPASLTSGTGGTPNPTDRPCDWTGLALSIPFDVTDIASTICGGTVTTHLTGTISKTAGSDTFTVAYTISVSTSGIMSECGVAQNGNSLPGTGIVFNIGCTLYRFRVFAYGNYDLSYSLGRMFLVAQGNGRIVLERIP
jgi:hypothetical protein